MKKIAVVRRNGLGDLLCAFPLINYFQKYQPDAQITLFVDKRNAPLIPYLPPQLKKLSSSLLRGINIGICFAQQ